VTSPESIRRRRRWREKFGIGYRIGVAGVALCSAVAQALIPRVFPTAPLWVVPSLVIATAVAVFRDNAVNVNRRLREPERQKLRVQAQKAAAVALYSVAQQKALDMADLGISVFLVERTGWIRRRQHLSRLIRLRLKDAPQASDIVWTKGKGVIGQAWEKGRPVHERTSELAKKYGGKELTDYGWSRVGQAARQGFAREEFETTVHKYAEILAVPIKDENGAVLGVVSMDLAMSTTADLGRTWLDGPEVEEFVSVAAELIAKTLGRS